MFVPHGNAPYTVGTCLQISLTRFPTSFSTSEETWQLVAGLEAALILVLFVGWLQAAQRPTSNADPVEDQFE